MPIKYVLGDFFLADIDNKIYCFRIDGNRIKTYRHTLVKSFRVMQYDTSHYMPVDAENLKNIEIILRRNSLPRIDSKLFGVLKLLGNQEKHDKEFTPHEIKSLVDMISRHEKEYPEQARNIENYLEQLGIDQIITPVRKLVEFIEYDIKATDPKFLGDVSTQHQRAELENKKMTNTPITGKGSIMKIILIVAIIAMVVGIGVVVWQGGYLNHIIPQIGSVGGPSTTQDYMKLYPTPEALKTAIDSGKIKMSDLPKEVQDMVNSYKPPVVTPLPPGSH